MIVSKTPPVFVFMEGVRLAHNHVLLLENKAFHHQVLTELYLNSNGKSNFWFCCGSKPETTAQKKNFLMKNTFAVTFTI